MTPLEDEMELKPQFRSMKEMKLEDFRPNGVICRVCGADFCEVDGHHCPLPVSQNVLDSRKGSMYSVKHGGHK